MKPMDPFLVTVVVVSLLMLVSVAGAVDSFGPGEDDPTRPAINWSALPDVENMLKGQILMTAELTSARGGPVGLSEPPMWTHQLTLKPVKVFRGDLPVGKPVTGGHVVRQKKEPTFPVGETCVVALSEARGRYRVDWIKAATPELLESARAVAALPLGWEIVSGAAVSPWAAMGEKAWPKGQPAAVGQIACNKTGRPAELVGPGVQLKVEPVPPPKAIQWTNPDGDGEYKITVTNTTDRPLEIPALLSDGKQILWDECLVIICQDKARPVPAAKGITTAVQPVVLKPGESVSTVVNALALTDVEWPQGGYRIEFQFCLGEKSSVQSFYYLSRHHDKVRAKALGQP